MHAERYGVCDQKGEFLMATQEERLQIVEFDLKHSKTETIKAYGDMAYEMVIIKGLTEDSIKRLSRLNETMEKRFERVDIRLDGMDAHLESHGHPPESAGSRQPARGGW